MEFQKLLHYIISIINKYEYMTCLKKITKFAMEIYS